MNYDNVTLKETHNDQLGKSIEDRRMGLSSYQTSAAPKTEGTLMSKTITQYSHMAINLQRDCYSRMNWEPVGWQFDPDTYRELQKLSYDWSINKDGQHTWLGLPVEVVIIHRPVDLNAKITDTAIHEPVCFAMVCRSRLTGRRYYLDDSQNDNIFFADGPSSLVVKVT